MEKETSKPLNEDLEINLSQFRKKVHESEAARADGIISLMISPVVHSCEQSEGFIRVVIRDKGGCNTFIELMLAYSY